MSQRSRSQQLERSAQRFLHVRFRPCPFQNIGQGLPRFSLTEAKLTQCLKYLALRLRGQRRDILNSAIVAAICVSETKSRRDATFNTELSVVGCAVVGATQRDEVVRFMLATIVAGANVVEI